MYYVIWQHRSVGLRIGVDLAGLLGGRMASAEGGSVPSGVGYGKGRPLSSRLRGLGSVRFWRILKATERSFLYLYDKIWGGTICISVPRSKFWGTCPPCCPVIYAHGPAPFLLFSFACFVLRSQNVIYPRLGFLRQIGRVFRASVSRCRMVSFCLRPSNLSWHFLAASQRPSSANNCIQKHRRWPSSRSASHVRAMLLLILCASQPVLALSRAGDAERFEKSNDYWGTDPSQVT